jgi:hypothetical protein
MPNGTGLNPGALADLALQAGLALSGYKNAFVLPKPGSDSLYYLFCSEIVHSNQLPQGNIDSYFYCNIIDMHGNNGLGILTDRNHILISDYIVGQGGMAACKHANGRDWWIFVPKLFTNCFYQFLLSPEGIDSMGLQCVGDSFASNTNRGAASFTPDGSKFIWCTPYDSLHIMDFDRCTGLLNSNIPKIAVYDSISTAMQVPLFEGISVSPNSRYLYVSSGSELWQFDLWADTIAKSEFLIENLAQTNPQSTTESTQLGPDGKIYISPIGADTFFHVINAPDSHGLACNFRENGLLTPTWHFDAMPLYPNYRLGALVGSACDTIPVDTPSAIHNLTNEESLLKIYPNPASDYAIVDYGFTDWSKGVVNLEIRNDLGELVYQQQLPMYSGFQKIDISLWASGVYMAFIKRGGAVVAGAKFVRE